MHWLDKGKGMGKCEREKRKKEVHLSGRKQKVEKGG